MVNGVIEKKMVQRTSYGYSAWGYEVCAGVIEDWEYGGIILPTRRGTWNLLREGK